MAQHCLTMLGFFKQIRSRWNFKNSTYKELHERYTLKSLSASHPQISFFNAYRIVANLKLEIAKTPRSLNTIFFITESRV